MAWLGTWKYRRKITISNTNVDAVLSNFPIFVNISSSSGTGNTDLTSIFDELTSDANRKKIAITTSDGTTQCYVEIERWSDANEKAELWVKVLSVASGAVTYLYIYYDILQADNTTYIGDVTDTPAQSVWDSNFKLVIHMAQDPSGGSLCIKDSTVNANHATSYGSMTSGDLIEGDVGLALDFDGINDYLKVLDDDSLSSDQLTIEICFKLAVNQQDKFLLYKGSASGNREYAIGFANIASPNTPIICYFFTGGSSSTFSVSTTTLATDTLYNLAFKKDATDQFLYINGTQEDTDANANLIGNYASDLYIATYGGATASFATAHKSNEVRISNSSRSTAWLKATHYSNYDTLASYGVVESEFEEDAVVLINCTVLESDLHIIGNEELIVSMSMISEAYDLILIGPENLEVVISMSLSVVELLSALEHLLVQLNMSVSAIDVYTAAARASRTLIGRPDAYTLIGRTTDYYLT